MVELQHDWVSLAAVDAGMRQQVIEHNRTVTVTDSLLRRALLARVLVWHVTLRSTAELPRNRLVLTPGLEPGSAE